jgi:hypothetical protein
MPENLYGYLNEHYTRRDELSSEVFGKPLAELSDAEMQIIYRAIPMNVSEIEPKDIRR